MGVRGCDVCAGCARSREVTGAGEEVTGGGKEVTGGDGQ